MKSLSRPIILLVSAVSLSFALCPGADTYPELVQEMVNAARRASPDVADKDLRVGVLPFQKAFHMESDIDGQGGNGVQPPMAALIREELESALVGTDGVQLYSRSELAALEKEIAFQEAFCQDDAEGSGELKVKGVDALLRGKYFSRGAMSTVYAELISVKDGQLLAKGKIVVVNIVPDATSPSIPAPSAEVNEIFNEAVNQAPAAGFTPTRSI